MKSQWTFLTSLNIQLSFWTMGSGYFKKSLKLFNSLSVCDFDSPTVRYNLHFIDAVCVKVPR
ncbi:hypothetical protein KL86CLO1_10459 [uncultured Eubacteriales bacterium]|uniref:Uncharacterized protein n=1 Tax=uncultured Eubacteriales bacterium TaxID=172733 RepID=A0A212J3N9_9FIRM|nr:hypothetical protein KL86CLO1_10459 [uncultured Eubacteriales bacterium]